MSDPYLLLKWLHVVSSTLLFGTGLGTAYYFWMAHRSGNADLIAKVGRFVIRADWLFTGTSGLVQLASGLGLVAMAGYSLSEPWLLAALGLYLLAFSCWAPVVVLQIKATALAAAAAADGAPLGATYHRLMRYWFVLGWPSFIALLVTFYLMVAKPDL